MSTFPSVCPATGGICVAQNGSASWSGPAPGVSVCPYCHTICFVALSTANTLQATRSLMRMQLLPPNVAGSAENGLRSSPS